jgi:hypothetical protein
MSGQPTFVDTEIVLSLKLLFHEHAVIVKISI